MSRALNLRMNEGQAVAWCEAEKIGISAIEPLPSGGVRLVCMSADGAQTAREKLKTKVIQGEVTRQKHRPTKPLW